MQNRRLIQRALISVSDKVGIVEFAKALFSRGIELISTSGTAHFLKKRGLPVIKISDYIDFPEIMNGRLKSLHPKIFGSILGRRDQDSEIMDKYGIVPVDMVVVNFYPFSQLIKNKNYSFESIIENIDIGGPAMVRSAAKNYKDITVIVNNDDYNSIIKEMDTNEGYIFLSTRFSLAIKAFEYIIQYDKIIKNYLKSKIFNFHHKNYKYNTNINKVSIADRLPNELQLNLIKKQDLRYGENKHQNAALYITENIKEVLISNSQQLQGKDLSYNNIADADTALECVKEFTEPACVIVKHTNPCGVAVSNSIIHAYNLAYKADPISAFGGVIAFNRELDSETAKSIISHQFVELIISPSITEGALQIFFNKRNIRILVCGHWHKQVSRVDFRSINGGLLVQDRNLEVVNLEKLRIVTKRQPNEQELQDALFCWKVAKFVKSNAIVLAKNNMTIGIGAGQSNRLYSTKIAIIKAKDNGFEIKGSTMASDAFFSFRDSIDMAIGITCIIQPGGSIHDDKVIAAANENNVAMIFTGIRHFRH